jgi:NADH dehydrogenase
MTKVPTVRRKVAVVTDWTLAFLFRRDVTSLWSAHQPFHEFSSVAKGEPPSRSRGLPG